MGTKLKYISTAGIALIVGFMATLGVDVVDEQPIVYDEGYFKGTAGLAGVTVGLNIITDVGTGSANELVVADGAAEQLVGRSMETAIDRETFMFKLDPRNFDIA